MPNTRMQNIGIDMVEIARVRRLLDEERKQFIDNTFSAEEQQYCFSYHDPAPHLAGTFAAKEAVRKAAGLVCPFSEIEVRHAANGAPEVWVRGARADSIAISITHTSEHACATALAEQI